MQKIDDKTFNRKTSELFMSQSSKDIPLDNRVTECRCRQETFAERGMSKNLRPGQSEYFVFSQTFHVTLCSFEARAVQALNVSLTDRSQS